MEVEETSSDMICFHVTEKCKEAQAGCHQTKLPMSQQYYQYQELPQELSS
jgi:hypothetical protein